MIALIPSVLAFGVEEGQRVSDSSSPVWTQHPSADASTQGRRAPPVAYWRAPRRWRSAAADTPLRHFVDPSLALAALRAGPDRLLRDLNLLGLAFESMVVRDLRVHAQAPSGRVLQYRDNTGLEVDAVVETSNDRWAAFEVKLGAGLVDEGADSLLRFADRIDTERCGPPAVLGVIVGTGYGYVRPDGIAVVPIGSLGP